MKLVDQTGGRVFIGEREVSVDSPPLVIPEIGINHEGSLEKAVEMVDACIAAGAECVKFQCHITEAEMIPTDMTPGDISNEKLWEIIKRCELSEKEEHFLMEYCSQNQIMYLSTPFSREAADRLESYDIPAYKIGSGECNNVPLLTHISTFGKPIILSTGMNDLQSIRRSVKIVQDSGCPLVLMHCTSMYPTPYDQVRLGAMQDLDREFNCPVGLSDHSLGIYASLGAVALGATVIEKHFTISRSWPGPDTSMSIEPYELKELIAGSKAVYESCGGAKSILPEEAPVIEFAYASVVAIDEINPGDKFSRDNIWVKRPGTGELLADRLDDVLGRTSLSKIAKDDQIRVSDIRDFK